MVSVSVQGTFTERLPLGLDYTSEKQKLNDQNQENLETNLENMKRLGQNKNFEVKEEDNVEISQQTTSEAEKTVPKGKQKDTKQNTDNI